MAEYRYHWFITTLTPLHIGSGERLREGFDFVSHDGALWVVNQGALFRTILEEAMKVRTADEATVAAEIAGMTLNQFMVNQWLRAEHFDLRRGIFAYRLPGSTSKKGQQGELFVHIKDIENRPYLPGTSLKGALRSAPLRHLAAKDEHKPLIFYEENINPKTQRNRLRANAKRAAEFEEGRHFVPTSRPASQEMHLETKRLIAAPIYSGFAITNPSRRREDAFRNPHYDLWRALRIVDSAPRPIETLALGQAIFYGQPSETRRRTIEEAIPIDLELIPAGVTFEALSWVETWLFENQRAARELRFHDRQKQWLTSQLCQIVNEESRLRLVEETSLFMELVKHDTAVRNTQRALDKIADEYVALSANEMILPVGKGTGWRSKTLGRVLQERMNDDEFTRMVQDFNLGDGMWKRSEQIPYTRLLASAGEQRLAPMGWVKIRLELKKQA
ncbi:MAG: type III-A CRISPR-associated RAMP protein Csm5 [Candidatus Hadarchaeum sp.]